jgi:LysR family transcriptional activator of nhaA
MIPFNYHHLYYFYTIAKMGSISKAGEELRLAQPTLSSQLKQFENYLNLKLFEREGKKLIITDRGRYILSYAAEIFDTGRELMDGLGDLSQKGRLKIQIGVSSYVPRSVVDALLKFLLKIEPGIYMSVQENSAEVIVENLKTHLLDFVLTDTPVSTPTEGELENHLVAKIPIVFCAHASIAKKYKRLPKDLDGAPVLLPTTQSQVYQSVQEYFIANKIKPKIVAEIQDVELVRRLVLTGIGVAPLNQFTITQAPSKEPLVILDKKLKHNIFDNIYLLVKKRKKQHPLIQNILNQFKLSP